MKNTRIISVPIIILMLASCSQKEILDDSEINFDENMYNKEYIKGAELTEQLDYRVFHLAQLVNKAKSEKINYSKLLSKKMGKDRNYNQLFFRDLIYSNSLDNKGNGVDEETEFSLNAFNGMDERDLLPYI